MYLRDYARVSTKIGVNYCSVAIITATAGLPMAVGLSTDVGQWKDLERLSTDVERGVSTPLALWKV